MSHVRKRASLVSAGAALWLLSSATPAAAEQLLRVQVDQRGDFTLIGNTLGWDCGAGAQAPVVGTVSGNCGSGSGDTAPDLFWRSEDPADGQATATLATSVAQARSTAVLELPEQALVTHAFLYWGGRLAGTAADDTATVERPGVFNEDLSASATYTVPVATTVVGGVAYQAVADVTDLVSEHESGAYRVSGVDTLPFPNSSEEVNFAGWALVVLYRLDSEPPRNLAVFDGLDPISFAADSEVSLSGFVVPNAGFDAKLGTLVYEGDTPAITSGDSLLFGTAPLDDADRISDAQNPVDNFFNGTRSWLGAPVSVAGDLPQLRGTAGSMGGMDLDVVDVTARMSPGQTQVDVRANTSFDEYYLGAFVTSISTFRPDFITSPKTVRDVNGDYVAGGDELEYTIEVVNTGNDASVDTVVTDPLPEKVTFVAGSLNVTEGANQGPKTDAPGDDQASYDAATHTLTVHLGAGATASQGGSIPAGERSTFTFRVRVEDGVSGLISNQATITAAGERGAPSASTVTDGNGDAEGAPPTTIPTGQCMEDMECGGVLPYCDVEGEPPTCVGCTEDEHCTGPESVCDESTHECVCPGEPRSCIDSDDDGLSDPDEEDLGTDPEDADSDDDGVIDGDEVEPGEDSDGDGDINALDPDSDDDGLFDGTEQGKGCSHGHTDASRMQCRPDGDMGATTTDPTDPDTDDGGVQDGVEDTNQDGVVDSGERDPTAGHGDDDDDIDTDGDGLNDGEEDEIGSDPEDADSDDDGVRDGDEPDYDQDTDGDGTINVLDPDSDGDGIPDGTELGHDCADGATDTARGHCVPDADMGETTTSPVDPDTDMGGVGDGDEDANQDGAIDDGESDPNRACDDNAAGVCSNLTSLAGAGGCDLSAPGRASLSALWLVGLLSVLVLVRRRRRA